MIERISSISPEKIRQKFDQATHVFKLLASRNHDEIMPEKPKWVKEILTLYPAESLLVEQCRHLQRMYEVVRANPALNMGSQNDLFQHIKDIPEFSKVNLLEFSSGLYIDRLGTVIPKNETQTADTQILPYARVEIAIIREPVWSHVVKYNSN